MDLFGGGESLDALNTVGFSDDDLVAGTVGFGTHFALDRLVPALEEIKHGGNYRMTRGNRKKRAALRRVVAQSHMNQPQMTRTDMDPIRVPPR